MGKRHTVDRHITEQIQFSQVYYIKTRHTGVVESFYNQTQAFNPTQGKKLRGSRIHKIEEIEKQNKTLNRH